MTMAMEPCCNPTFCRNRLANDMVLLVFVLLYTFLTIVDITKSVRVRIPSSAALVCIAELRPLLRSSALCFDQYLRRRLLY